jgi:hypothetical protein
MSVSPNQHANPLKVPQVSIFILSGGRNIGDCQTGTRPFAPRDNPLTNASEHAPYTGPKTVKGRLIKFSRPLLFCEILL